MSFQPSAAQLQYEVAHEADTKLPWIVGIATTCMLMAFVALGLRLWARRLSRSRLGADDWCLIVGVVLLAAHAISFAVSSHYGYGRHIWIAASDPGMLQTLLKLLTTTELLNYVSLFFVQISILCLYVRLFPVRWFRITIWIVGLALFIYTLGAFFSTLLQCVPIAAQWDPSIPHTCLDFVAFLVASAVINVVTDLLILILPIPIIWKLNTTSHKKRMLILVFSMGAIVCCFTVVRVVLIVYEPYDTDPTWDYVAASLLAMVQIALGVVSVSLPTYGHLLNKVRTTWSTSSTSRGSEAWSNKYRLRTAKSSNGTASTGHTWTQIEEIGIMGKDAGSSNLEVYGMTTLKSVDLIA